MCVSLAAKNVFIMAAKNSLYFKDYYLYPNINLYIQILIFISKYSNIWSLHFFKMGDMHFLNNSKAVSICMERKLEEGGSRPEMELFPEMSNVGDRRWRDVMCQSAVYYNSCWQLGARDSAQQRDHVSRIFSSRRCVEKNISHFCFSV